MSALYNADKGMNPFSSESTALFKKFLNIRSRVDALNIPASVFTAIHYDNAKTIRIAESGSQTAITKLTIDDARTYRSVLLSWFRNRVEQDDRRDVAVTFANHNEGKDVRATLWLELDIVSFHAHVDSVEDTDLKVLADGTLKRFRKELVPELNVGEHNVVNIHPLVDPATYHADAGEDYWRTFEHEKKRFGKKNLLFISATPQGGGVALMRHALIRFFEQVDVDARWCVMLPDPDAFLITKTKFHNVLQGVAPPDTRLSEADKDQYARWTKENAQSMEHEIRRADVIVIDDPQPSGMIPDIKSINPEAKLLYRSHIQLVAEKINTPGTPQHDVWQELWKNIRECDACISHPIQAFVPDTMPKERLLFMPATTDPLDGLNKPLSVRQQHYYANIFDKVLLEHNQSPLDPERPYIVQIARFDPSKGIPDVVEAAHLVRERLKKDGVKELPQFVIAGNGSIDDPDGSPIYNLTKSMLEQERYKEMHDDVKFVRLPHIDQLLNTLLRKSLIALQLSHKEGFEIKVTEALMKGKPVVAYRAGGIPLQIEDGVTGFVIPEVGDVDGVADVLYTLLTNKEQYEKISHGAALRARRDVLTVPNAINWLFLANETLDGTLNVSDSGFVERLKALQTGLSTTPSA